MNSLVNPLGPIALGLVPALIIIAIMYIVGEVKFATRLTLVVLVFSVLLVLSPTIITDATLTVSKYVTNLFNIA